MSFDYIFLKKFINAQVKKKVTVQLKEFSFPVKEYMLMEHN
jgi:hypothetical protein